MSGTTRMGVECTTHPRLLELLKKAAQHKMTPAEIDAQRRSWVRGEMGIEHPEMTDQEIERLIDDVLGPSPYARIAALEVERDGYIRQCKAWRYSCETAERRVAELEAFAREVRDYAPGVTHEWAESLRRRARAILEK